MDHTLRCGLRMYRIHRNRKVNPKTNKYLVTKLPKERRNLGGASLRKEPSNIHRTLRIPRVPIIQYSATTYLISTKLPERRCSPMLSNMDDQLACRCTCAVPFVRRSSSKRAHFYSTAAFILNRDPTHVRNAANASVSSLISRSI